MKRIMTNKLRDVYSNIKIKDIIDVESICNSTGMVWTETVSDVNTHPDWIRDTIKCINDDNWIFKEGVDYLFDDCFPSEKEDEESKIVLTNIAEFIDYVMSGESISLLCGKVSEKNAERIFNNTSFAESLLKIGISAKYTSEKEYSPDPYSNDYETRCYMTIDILASDEDIDRINKSVVDIKSAKPFNKMIKHYSEKVNLIGFDTNKFNDYINFLNNISFEDRLVLMTEEMSELQKECTKTLRGKGDREHFIEEVADVLITLTAGCKMMGITQKELDKVIISKSKRYSYDKL